MTRRAASFDLIADYEPGGDQPQAIQEIIEAFERNEQRQTLLGVTGSGKTFTMANVVSQLNVPTLVMAHNKTLAAQLYGEFKELFPNNAVEYFVSYYDYYQPEAYVPSSDTYIAKDSNINEAIDRMRHSATRSLLERSDVLIVSSVSCIYGIGSAEAYYDMLVFLEVGQEIDRDKVLRKLTDIQYERNAIDFHRGTFRVRGDVLEVFPAHESDRAVRIEWFGEEVESISIVDPLRGRTVEQLDRVAIYPSSHYVVKPQTKEQAVVAIRDELKARLSELRAQGKLLEAQRLEERTNFDLEMMETMGYCNGIENYSRHLTGRSAGQPPPTLLEYFPRDFLLLLDESHQTVPQVGGMYRGDRARKTTLVDYGFRLPSALDNRPLRFDEFDHMLDRVIYVSATPGDYELDQSKGVIVEQIIRPTGLVDPSVVVKPASTQVDDLLEEIQLTLENGYRVLVTTLTKRMAEDLTEFLTEANVKTRYLHSDIDTIERMEILKDLRLGTFEVLVGINLLREGLDLPEVALVAVLDADKEGFLRSSTSLIQTIGRAARNVEGRVVLYADQMTDSLKFAIDETERRRTKQIEHNTKLGITPQTIRKAVKTLSPIDPSLFIPVEEKDGDAKEIALDEIPKTLEELRTQMKAAADALEYEKAAQYRDKIRELEQAHLEFG